MAIFLWNSLLSLFLHSQLSDWAYLKSSDWNGNHRYWIRMPVATHFRDSSWQSSHSISSFQRAYALIWVEEFYWLTINECGHTPQQNCGIVLGVHAAGPSWDPLRTKQIFHLMKISQAGVESCGCGLFG